MGRNKENVQISSGWFTETSMTTFAENKNVSYKLFSNNDVMSIRFISSGFLKDKCTLHFWSLTVLFQRSCLVFSSLWQFVSSQGQQVLSRLQHKPVSRLCTRARRASFKHQLSLSSKSAEQAAPRIEMLTLGTVSVWYEWKECYSACNW